MPRAILWLAFGAFVIGTESFVIAGLLPALSNDLNVSLALAGQLVSSYALTYALASPILTVLTASWRRDVVLKLGIALFALANLLAAAAPSFGWMVGARILLALCVALFMPMASGYAATSVAPDRRGRALAWIYSGYTTAVLMGAPLGTLIGNHFGWRATFQSVAALGGLAFFGVLASIPRQAPQPALPWAARVAVLRRRPMQLVLGTTFLTLAGAFAIYTYLAPYLRDVAGVTARGLSVALLVFGAGGAVGNLVGGTLADKTDARRAVSYILLVLAAIFASLSVIPLLWPPAAALYPVFFVLAAWGVIGWAFAPAQQARVVQLEPTMAPVALSFNASAIQLGISAGSALGSLVIAHGTPGGLGWVGALCVFGGWLVLVSSPERRAEPTPATPQHEPVESPWATDPYQVGATDRGRQIAIASAGDDAR